MLSEFGVSSFDKTLRVDSQSALAIAIGQGSWRTRHLRVRANYLREQYESGEIIPVYCPGVEQAADLLTKALPSARILELAASGVCLSMGHLGRRKLRPTVKPELWVQELWRSKTCT